MSNDSRQSKPSLDYIAHAAAAVAVLHHTSPAHAVVAVLARHPDREPIMERLEFWVSNSSGRRPDGCPDWVDLPTWARSGGVPGQSRYSQLLGTLAQYDQGQAQARARALASTRPRPALVHASPDPERDQLDLGLAGVESSSVEASAEPTRAPARLSLVLGGDR